MPDNLNQEDFNSFLKRDTFRFYVTYGLLN